MSKTLLIPGFRGSEPGHWQRHWDDADVLSAVVEQEDWDEPVLSEWLAVVEAHLAAHPRAILVAHSLGCLLVAHLSTRPSASHVAGALLVAPADAWTMARVDPIFSDFADFPRVELPFPSIVVASRNDPFMALETARDHADVWGSAFIDYGEAGHINVASGFGPWRDGFALAASLRNRIEVSSFGVHLSADHSFGPEGGRQAPFLARRSEAAPLHQAR